MSQVKPLLSTCELARAAGVRSRLEQSPIGAGGLGELTRRAKTSGARPENQVAMASDRISFRQMLLPNHENKGYPLFLLISRRLLETRATIGWLT